MFYYGISHCPSFSFFLFLRDITLSELWFHSGFFMGYHIVRALVSFCFIMGYHLVRALVSFCFIMGYRIVRALVSFCFIMGYHIVRALVFFGFIMGYHIVRDSFSFFLFFLWDITLSEL